LAAALVTVIVVVGGALGLAKPAAAATPQASANSALVCLWVPVLNVGLC
jgi:hypothetical protein